MLKFERRYLDRLVVPSAEIEYKLRNGKSAKVGLIDITKISIRFYIKHNFTKGDLVDLTILIKGKKSINVAGNVIWTQSANENGEDNANAVVQLLPFGTNESINSLESYEQLAQLVEEYSKDDKVRKNIYKA